MIYYHYTRGFFWLFVPAHKVTSMVTVEKGPPIILFYQILFCICCEFCIFWIIVWFLSWFKSFTWFYFNSFSVIKQWISLIYFYVYMIRQWTNCDGLWLWVRVVLSQFISSNFIWILFFKDFFFSLQQVCFVLMLIFAISFFLSSCFVHLFTFLSLFLHSREQWLKCAYIFYSFVVFIPNNSEQILFAYLVCKYQLYSRGWWQNWYKCACKKFSFKFFLIVASGGVQS